MSHATESTVNIFIYFDSIHKKRETQNDIPLTRLFSFPFLYCVLSSLPMLYETILLQSILVRVTGNCLRNALNVVSDIFW